MRRPGATERDVMFAIEEVGCIKLVSDPEYVCRDAPV
jgi:hypothetical protein